MTPSNPTPAIWTHRRPDFKGGFIPTDVKVEVVGATEKSYRIKVAGTSELKNVRKHNVKLMVVTPPRDLSDVRLPYKD